MVNTRKIIPEPPVTVNIVSGKTDDYRKRLWRAFWAHLLAKVQGELNANSETKGENKTKV